MGERPEVGAEHRALYRTVIDRVDAADWDALRRRVEAADRLGRAAATDPVAWDVQQLVEWRLHRRGSCRPTDPGDVLVLDRLYRHTESRLPPVSLPPLGPRAFCARLAEDVRRAAHLDPSPIERLAAATVADWRYLVRNLLPETLDFTRLIALASVRLPHRFARSMYANLYDEAGRGDWAANHYRLFADLAGWLEVPIPGFGLADDDDDELLDWAAPDVIGEANAHRRAVTHDAPGWALGSMFVVEHLVPFDFAPLVTNLRALGVPERALAFFAVHVDVDPGHADDWIEVVEAYATTPDEQRIVYTSALDAARWFARGWLGMCDGWGAWVRTGVPPHLPARALAAP
ncbi:MAG: iron-containing redox enzyme family protein [Myxococcota bacterium]